MDGPWPLYLSGSSLTIHALHQDLTWCWHWYRIVQTSFFLHVINFLDFLQKREGFHIQPVHGIHDVIQWNRTCLLFMHLVHEEYSQYGHYTEYNLTMVLSIFNLCSTMERSPQWFTIPDQVKDWPNIFTFGRTNIIKCVCIVREYIMHSHGQ